MPSRNVMVGTGTALAGLGGLAAAALTAGGAADNPTPAKTAAQTVETRTVVVRTVEHRITRLKPRHQRQAAQAATATAAPAVAPVVQQAPARAAVTPAPVSNPAPIRTRTSGGHGTSGGDDGGRHDSQRGGDDTAEHQDD